MKQETLFQIVTLDFRGAYDKAISRGQAAQRELLLKLTLYLTHTEFIVNRVAWLRSRESKPVKSEVLERILSIIDGYGIRQAWEQKKLTLEELTNLFFDSNALEAVFTEITGQELPSELQPDDPWAGAVPDLAPGGPIRRVSSLAAGSDPNIAGAKSETDP